MRSSRRSIRRRWRVAWVLAYLLVVSWSLVTVTGLGSHRPLSVLCSTIDELCREWAEDFRLSTGIEVSMLRVSSGEALARLSRPGARGQFDVWHGGTADSYAVAQSRGLLVPYRPADSDAIPSEWKDPQHQWTGVYLGVLGFCSHRRLLAERGLEVPHSWDDLANPALANLVVLPRATSSGTGYTLAWTTRLRLGSEDAAVEYLAKLNDQGVHYTLSGLAPARIVGRGESAVGVTFTQHCVKAASEGMTDLVVSYPREATGYEIGGVALIDGSPDGEVARRYVDYAVSARAQTAGSAGQLPTRTDLPSRPELGGGVPLQEYLPDDAAKARQRLTSRVAEVQT